MVKDKIRIGELATCAGVTPRTIRYYESLGLLEPGERAGQGFRYYTEAELLRLKKIDHFKQLGLTLEEISEVIGFYYEDPSGVRGKQRVLEMLQRHLAGADRAPGRRRAAPQARCAARALRGGRASLRGDRAHVAG